MTTYLKLAGPGAEHPKACLTPGWQDPSYKGISATDSGWIGMRLDKDWIVVDCDDEDAKEAWLQHIDRPLLHTWVRKTPHGWHFFYRRTSAALSVRAHKPVYISPKIDLKLGYGHQVVYLAPGYSDLTTSSLAAMAFDPDWVKDPEQAHWTGDEWDEVPDGIGDNCMTSIAGVMRRWGMSETAVALCLSDINDRVMTTDPMPMKSIRRIAKQAAKWDPADAKTVLCPSCGNEVETR